MDRQLFTKVTGLTFDPSNLSEEKLAWLIPDGAMLEGENNRRAELTKEFMEDAGLDLSEKFSDVEPEEKPEEPVVPAEPVEEESTAYDYVWDEASWNESEANGALAKYHAKYPEEDWWNNAANRACNYNDRVYIGTLIDSEASANVSASASWASEAAQKLVIDGVEYYGAIFYGFEPQDVALFNDVALTESANKTLSISSITYSSDCGRSWAGAVNNPGAQYPWVCPNITENVNAKIRFEYEGADPVYPWGDKLFNAGDWGCESVAKLFGIDFDINKFKMILVKQ